jgi:hypothetical protein
MTALIFAGPSLHGYQHLLPPGIELRAPAARGDMMLALRLGARRIGLIDGYFGDRPSVWHKEILLAKSEGAVVFGAASMGALRAAECAAYGMIGVGEIFAAFASGRRIADADVAVLHGPEELGFPALTVALVDAEDAIGWMERHHRIGPGDAELLRLAASDLHFHDRAWSTMRVAAGLPRSFDATIESALRDMGPLQKTRDALELSKLITAHPSSAHGISVPMTSYLIDLETFVRRQLGQRTA